MLSEGTYTAEVTPTPLYLGIASPNLSYRHIILHFIMSYCFTLYHVILYYINLILLYHIVLYCITYASYFMLQEMIRSAESFNSGLTWILRTGGILINFLGFTCLTQIIRNAGESPLSYSSLRSCLVSLQPSRLLLLQLSRLVSPQLSRLVS